MKGLVPKVQNRFGAAFVELPFDEVTKSDPQSSTYAPGFSTKAPPNAPKPGVVHHSIADEDSDKDPVADDCVYQQADWQNMSPAPSGVAYTIGEPESDDTIAVDDQDLAWESRGDAKSV